jgi:hypothetical protein
MPWQMLFNALSKALSFPDPGFDVEKEDMTQ